MQSTASFNVTLGRLFRLTKRDWKDLEAVHALIEATKTDPGLDWARAEPNDCVPPAGRDFRKQILELQKSAASRTCTRFSNLVLDSKTKQAK